MEKTLLESWQELTWPAIKSSKPLATGEGVIDESAFSALEIDRVFDSINQAETLIGQAVLYRSLCQPLSDIKAIKAKQDALKELEKNTALKQQISAIIASVAQQEKYVYLLMFGEFLGFLAESRNDNEISGYGYKQYRNGVQFFLDLVNQVQQVDTPNSKYLKAIFAKINGFAQTRYYSLMQGPVYFLEGKIKSKEEHNGSWFPVPVLFKPKLFKPVLLGGILILLWMLQIFSPFNFSPSMTMVSIVLGPLLLLYFPVVGGYDRDNCIIPLRNEYKNAEPVAEVLDAVGQLDELLSFLKYAESFPHTTVIPKLEDTQSHRINLKYAVNPVLGKDNPNYVGNDFSLEDDKLVLITGPNSGGKTAFCKTLTQIQAMTQIGSFVPAKSATLSVADKIFYQAPEISHLDDGEGRFGTELKRTKDIFVATTEKSLVVLDELSEGTTFEEKMEASSNVLNGFYRKGNSTVLITHNHQLVDAFNEAGTCIAKQVEFANDMPTYRLVPGISRVSHADRVAKKIGFSKEDIENYLTKKK